MKNIGKIIGITILTLALLGGFGTGGYYMYKNWDTIKGWFTQISAEPVTPDVSETNVTYDFELSANKIVSYYGSETDIMVPAFVKALGTKKVEVPFMNEANKIIGSDFTLDWWISSNQNTLIYPIKFIESDGKEHSVENADMLVRSLFDSFLSYPVNIEKTVVRYLSGDEIEINRIGEYAFSNKNLTSVKLEEGIVTIDSAAFSNNKIETFNFSSTVKNVATSPSILENNVGLKIVNFNGMQTLPGKILSHFAGLKSYTIPENFKSLSSAAFADCVDLKEIHFNNSITTISDNAFFGCSSLTEFVVPQTITEISFSAFSRCVNLKKIFIPSSVLSISKGTYGMLYGSNENVVVYVESSEKPADWAANCFEYDFRKNAQVVYNALLSDYEAA